MSRKKAKGVRPVDPQKTPKIWEKARRERMKIFFNELQEVLPLYDPSAPMSRFEILQKSRSYIKDLQAQNQDLLDGGFDEVYKEKMENMKQRVKELLRRVDQLTDLLRTANIMIPPTIPFPENQESLNSAHKWINQRPKKWTDKITVVPEEKIEKVLLMIKDSKKKSTKLASNKKLTKKNDKSCDTGKDVSEVPRLNIFMEKVVIEEKKKIVARKSKLKDTSSDNSSLSNNVSSDNFTDSQSPSHAKENQPIDFNLPQTDEQNREETNPKTVNETCNVPNESENSNNVVNKSSVNETPKTVNENTVCKLIEQPQNNVILPTGPSVMQQNTFLLTNDGNLVQFPMLNSPGNVFNANSNILAQTAIVNPTNSGLITPLVINRPSPVIVLQKPAPQVIQTAQIVNSSPGILSVPKPSIQILGNSVVYATSTSNSKALPYILSKPPANKKRITRDSTVTTYVNKIPIPALSKQSYAKKSANLISSKGKNAAVRGKEAPAKQGNENEKSKQCETVTSGQGNTGETNMEAETEKNRVETSSEESEAVAQKRKAPIEVEESAKKKRITENPATDENLFKPIDNPVTTEILCNLKLPDSINPSLSVSPTAAFLSSFPIVAPSKADAEEENASKNSKTEERKSEERSLKLVEGLPKEKDDLPAKPIHETPLATKAAEVTPTENLFQPPRDKPKDASKNVVVKPSICSNVVSTSTSIVSTSDNCSSIAASCASIGVSNGSIISSQAAPQQELVKSWSQYEAQKDCDPFYVSAVSDTNISFSDGLTEMTNTTYKVYNQNTVKTNFNVPNNLTEQIPIKNNQFEYTQKENFAAKNVSFSDRNAKKQCSESYNVQKNPPTYQADPGPTYQLIPAKEINRHTRPPVNWMTDPDVRSRSMNYAPQLDKMAKPYTQPETFYMNNPNQKSTSEYPTEFVPNNETNKMTAAAATYQKNDFYVNKTVDVQMKLPDQRCKKPDAKCLFKPAQNYNIFDYNYNVNCYPEEDANKYCNVQNFTSNGSQKSKKTASVTHPKKKTENAIQHLNIDHHPANDPVKRNTDQIISSMDFNQVPNQECFAWVPGKNMEWLPSKAFGVDTNLVVPSTLPTLVGDLALGTNSTNEVAQISKAKTCQTNANPKSDSDPAPKHYVELGLSNNSTFSKTVEPSMDNKQFLEPFTNLSKNIFDVTPANSMQPPLKNDFEKPSYNPNSNETIVLKNIFELPASKSFGNEFNNSRTKQRNMTNPQNNFLSVSQLVETPNFENSPMKSDTCQSDNTKTNYPQNYPNYPNMKQYKNKARNSHYKYNDRKYNYKNSSSNYTAEALIRSNSNVNFQNDFNTEVNTNFFNAKNNQNLVANNNELQPKADFVAPSQNIYTEFNFSSPVPNFNITSMNTEFVNHDTNFAGQNNSFFGDFIPPEYPLTESVSNSLLLPPCSIGLQNPFIIDKRNTAAEKTSKTQTKNYANSRNRKFECSKSSYNDFSIVHNTTGAVFTNSSITCPPIFTTSTCQNLLPVQNVSEPNITFSGPSFTTNNITFPPLATNSNANFHRFSSSGHNAATTSSSFLSSTSHPMFTASCSTTTLASHSCFSTNSATSVAHSVITTPFSVGNSPFSTSTQSTLPFLSLPNPIIPPSVPTTSGNSLANFNLSTIFPEINQKGNYHYP